MHYIKVPATESTHTELKARFKKGLLRGNTCLSTDKQTGGRGQRGTHWKTEHGKNLTLSVLMTDLNLPVTTGFALSAAVSLELVKTLKQELPKQSFFIKWPNDILAGSQKIAGILIENILSKSTIRSSVISIGLNVNQTNFSQLEHAGSLKSVSRRHFNRQRLLTSIVGRIDHNLISTLKQSRDKIWSDYEGFLFRINKPSIFEYPDSRREQGIIAGIDQKGHLIVNFKDRRQHFDLKEIKLIY